MKNINPVLYYFLLLSLFSLCYLVYTFPLILNLNDTFIGAGDVHIFIYNLVNLEVGDNPSYTNLMFFPDGHSTLMHTSCLTMSYFSNLFSNPVLGLNVYLLLSFSFSGLGAYIFSRKYLNNSFHAFVLLLLDCTVSCSV